MPCEKRKDQAAQSELGAHRRPPARRRLGLAQRASRPRVADLGRPRAHRAFGWETPPRDGRGRQGQHGGAAATGIAVLGEEAFDDAVLH